MLLRNLRKLFDWSSLNRLGKNRILRSSYIWLLLVPIAAKMLSNISGTYDIPFFDETFTIHIAVPFSWKMFYLSAVCFAISSTIYSIFCPTIISNYQRYQDFKDEGKGVEQIKNELIKVIDMPVFIRSSNAQKNNQTVWFFRRYGFLQEVNDEQEIYNSNMPNYYSLITKNDISENKIPEAFWQIRDWAEYKRIVYRYMCGLIYVAAFIFAGIVLYQNFVYVWHNVL